jgi:sulfur carrier protein
LLAELARDSKKVAVEVNEEVVPREQHAERELRDGDRVEIVTLVGGG